MNRSERKAELGAIFQNCAILDLKTKKWKFDFALRKDDKVYTVCMPVYADVHGFNKSEFENFARELKERKLRDIESSRTAGDESTSLLGKRMPISDTSIPAFTYNQMEEIIRENVVSEGGFTGAPPIPKTIRYALSSSRDKQQLCIAWLQKYFESTGDVSPNSDFIKIDIDLKKKLFAQYVSETNLAGPSYDPRSGKKTKNVSVSYSRFCELWCVLFPYCVNRPWCNVPGKCDTCYEIQKSRVDPNFRDHYSQTMFQKLHAIHRGGLFNLERAEYVQLV